MVGLLGSSKGWRDSKPGAGQHFYRLRVRKAMSQRPIPAEHIDPRIMLVREHKVMLDANLAELYGVSTKALVQAVTRNIERFPTDFMFQLTEHEFRVLRSQIVTSNSISAEKRGGRRTLPYAFSEHGVAMLSSVLRSRRAIVVNIAIMLAFAAVIAIYWLMVAQPLVVA
jgi:hypothetical protein